jgi:hypothetical protein
MHLKKNDKCDLCGHEAWRHGDGSGACFVETIRLSPGIGPSAMVDVYSDTDVFTTPTWRTHPLACQPCTTEQRAVLDLAGCEETCGHQFSARELEAANLLAEHGVIGKRKRKGCAMPHYGPLS